MWQRTCDNQTNRPQQYWVLIEVRALQYLVMNIYTNKCLDVRDGSRADRAIIQQWACTGTSTSMLWTFEHTGWPGGNPYHLINVRTGKCVDVTGGSSDEYAFIQQYRCTYPNYAQSFLLLV
jgi:hypothetical protein